MQFSCCRICLRRLREPETDIHRTREDVAGQQQDLHPELSSWPSCKLLDHSPITPCPEQGSDHLTEKMVGPPTFAGDAEHREPFRVVERRRPGAGDPLRPERGEEGPQPSEMDIPGASSKFQV